MTWATLGEALYITVSQVSEMERGIYGDTGVGSSVAYFFVVPDSPLRCSDAGGRNDVEI